MTTELEKQFFDAFGIEAKYEDACRLADEYWQDEELANEYGTFDYFMEFSGCPEKESSCTDECRHAYCKTIYPQITDTHYLELHCLMNSVDQPPYGQNVKELKKDILICLIGIFGKNETTTFFEEIKHQVQALFEENNNDR